MEKFVADKERSYRLMIDYESDVNVAEIFLCKDKFIRDSKTKGAMHEPLRT